MALDANATGRVPGYYGAVDFVMRRKLQNEYRFLTVHFANPFPQPLDLTPTASPDLKYD